MKVLIVAFVVVGASFVAAVNHVNAQEKPAHSSADNKDVPKKAPDLDSRLKALEKELLEIERVKAALFDDPLCEKM